MIATEGCLHRETYRLRDGGAVSVEVFEPKEGTPAERVRRIVDLEFPDTVLPWTALAERAYLERTLKGEFAQHSLDLFFVAEIGDEIVAVTSYQVSRRAPDLGSFGWVHARSDHRGRGISSLLTEIALEWFRREGGLCLHLGTVNPVAHHIYEKYGFRDYNGIVMRYVAPPARWEGFDDELYAAVGSAEVRPADWGDAAGLGVLYAAPSPWFVKDYSEGLFSHSSVGPKRYLSVPASMMLRVEQRKGTLLVLENPRQRLVGATNLIAVDDTFQAHVQIMDFLVRPSYLDQAIELLLAAVQAARRSGSRIVRTCVAACDKEKQRLVSEAGFRQTAVLPAQFGMGSEYWNLEVHSLELT